LVLAALGAGCSDTTDTPGALLRGPGALAVFDGVVRHESGSQRKYLAIANTRGDELRLVDLTDNEVVSSPGLAFPLSIPVEGWPMWVAAAELGDGDRPDALVVIPSGSDVVEVVDTWSGSPTSILQLDLDPDDASPLDLDPDPRVLSVASVASPAAGVGRIVVGLTGGRLAVLDFVRDAADPLGLAIAQPSLTVLTGLGFEPVSLAQGGEPTVVYAASLTTVGGTPGVARIALPHDLSGWSAAASVTALDALVPTQAVAALSMGGVERVVAVPAPGSCGEGRALPCGLLAVDPAAGTLAAGVVAGETHLMPLPVPGTVAGLLALGRPDASITIASGGGTVLTRGVAVVSSTDGAVYLVDVERWTMASVTDPVAGDGRTRALGVTALAGEDAVAGSSQVGLWFLGGTSAAPLLSADIEDVAGRIRLTPGITPDDTWTLAWQGILPGLQERTADLTAADAASGTLAVVDEATDPAIALDLAALGVEVGDLLELGPVGGCTPSVRLDVLAVAGTVATVALPAGAAWADACVPGSVGVATRVAATLRAGGLVLTGASAGLAGRPPAFVPDEFVLDGLGQPTATPTAWEMASNEFEVFGARRFYVTDSCAAGSDCEAVWKVAPYQDVLFDPTDPGSVKVINVLDFPYPDGPALGLVAGIVDPACTLAPAACAAAAPPPPVGAALRFTTKSGLIPSPRRPLIDGSAVASALPSGLALWDRGADGLRVQASYTAGLVMIFDPAASISSMSVIH
jgi:hypothetical protein